MKSERVWLWGWHTVIAALKNPARQCYKLLIVPDLYPELPSLSPVIPIQRMTKREMDVRFAGAVHQNIALQAAQLPLGDLPEELKRVKDSKKRMVLLILDQITDPHNVGALLRTAVAFGVTGVVLLRNHTPPLMGVLAKAASGALEQIPIFQAVNMAQTLNWLKRHNFLCVGLAEEGEQVLSQIDLSSSLALVMGSEGKGLRRLTRENCDMLARLPTVPHFSSLNVSNAGAVALYEAFRSYTHVA